MFDWQRNLQSMILRFGKRLGSGYHSSANHTTCRAEPSLVLGKSCYTLGVWKSPSADISRSLYHYLQRLGISSSRRLHADSSEPPVPSLLMSGLSSDSGETKTKQVMKPQKTAQAVMKKIQQSPSKLNIVATLVRRMRVEDAYIQLRLLPRKAARVVYATIHSAQRNAAHNHGLDPDHLIIDQIFVGKGFYKKEISYHGKGMHGIMLRKQSRLTVILRELTAEEETKIARLKVEKFRKFQRLKWRERQLVPHQIIEREPVWGQRRRKPRHYHADDAQTHETDPVTN